MDCIPGVILTGFVCMLLGEIIDKLAVATLVLNLTQAAAKACSDQTLVPHASLP